MKQICLLMGDMHLKVGRRHEERQRKENYGVLFSNKCLHFALVQREKNNNDKKMTKMTDFIY